MTKKDKVAWLLLTPFLSGVAATFVYAIYLLFTITPWAVALAAVLISGFVGSCILIWGPEDFTSKDKT
jgi:hypothetical protein